MEISRRDFARLASAAVVFRAARASAAEPSVFVAGQDLPVNLDPHQVLDVQAVVNALNAYDNLYRYEDNPPKMQPWLAEGHTVSPDGLVWEFKLRRGVKFHDSSEVTGDDVVYSFQRLLAIGKAPSAPFLPVLKPDRVTAPDRYSIRFQLDKPYGPFFAMIPMVAIVNPRVVEPHAKDGDWGAGWLASNEAGSGAYRVIPATYVPLEHLDMEKYDDHFLGWNDNPRPIEKIACQPTKVTSTRVLALLNGSLDMTDSFLPVDQVERIEKAPNAHVLKNATMRLLLIRMNNTKPPFDNINARKCFAHAFNTPASLRKSLRATRCATRRQRPTTSGDTRKM
jgi:peptide/nickel transport system substrate-binding protein